LDIYFIFSKIKNLNQTSVNDFRRIKQHFYFRKSSVIQKGATHTFNKNNGLPSYANKKTPSKHLLGVFNDEK